MQKCKVESLIFFVLFICLFSFRPLPTLAETDGTHSGATLFIYHRFGESKYPTTNVSAENFREQLAYLMMNNYHVISLSDLVGAIKQQAPLPEKTAIITIDDGYRSTYEVAWPILQSFGYPFTVFLYVKGVEEGYQDYMTWNQIRELQAAGVDFQDHSYSHYRLGDKPAGLDETGYRAWISNDLQKGSRILTEKLGQRPQFFALPYGEYNSIVIDEAKAMGYEAVFTQDPGSVGLETDIFSVPREPILGNEWSTLAHFEEVINQVDMPVTVIEPPPHPLKTDKISRFGASLLYPERYQKGTMGVYVSGQGWHRAKVDGNFIYYDSDMPLQRHVNRVTVSGREKESGKLARRTWLLIRPEE